MTDHVGYAKSAEALSRNENNATELLLAAAYAVAGNVDVEVE